MIIEMYIYFYSIFAEIKVFFEAYFCKVAA